MSGLLLISPVRNEADHIELVARAVAAQTRPPDRWIVVDDGSDDATAEILAALRPEIPFLEVIPGPAPRRENGVDQLAEAAPPRAFNRGLESVDWRAFEYVGKLDGDVELPRDYFERLLRAFGADPALGIACGDLVERSSAGLRRMRIPPHHVHGALKLYRRPCFEAIGGIEERLAWDTIDETSARMRGFVTRSFPDIVALHHRPWASAGGRLRGRARHGRCAYIAHYSAWWVLLRSFKLATVPPYVIGGAAFLLGFVRAATTRSAGRVQDEELRRFIRSEHRARVRVALTPRMPRRRRNRRESRAPSDALVHRG